MLIETKSEPFGMPGAFPTTDTTATEDLPPPYSETDLLAAEPQPSTSSSPLSTHPVDVHPTSGNVTEPPQLPPRSSSTPSAHVPSLDTTRGLSIPGKTPAQQTTTPTHALADFSPVDSQKPLPNPPRSRGSSSASTSSLPSVPSASTSPVVGPSTSQPWLRNPSPDLSYERFSRMVHYSKGEQLSSGFAREPPNCKSQIHPFVTHDVEEGDWIHFLTGVERTASPASEAMTLRSSGLLSSVLGASKAGTSRSSLPPEDLASVRKTIEDWNTHFFRPRRIIVQITQEDAPELAPKTGASRASNACDAFASSFSSTISGGFSSFSRNLNVSKNESDHRGLIQEIKKSMDREAHFAQKKLGVAKKNFQKELEQSKKEVMTSLRGSIPGAGKGKERSRPTRYVLLLDSI